MKSIKKYIVLLLLSVITLNSCDDFDELNVNPNLMSTVTPGALLNPILYNMAVFNWSRSNSYSMELMQVSLPTNSSGGISRYIFSDNIGNSSWNTYYRWLNNIKEMEDLATASGDKNYVAISIVLRSWTIQLLTDAFGDVPYTEACQGAAEILQPKFDTQEQIYKKIIADLDSANNLFDLTVGLRYNTEGEFLFGTDATSTNIVKWKKFCNSLHLRVAMRMSNVDKELSKSEVEKIFSDPTTYPIFTNNGESALLAISGVSPQEAPMTRPQDFTAYRSVASFFIDNLNKWKDPRRAVWCSKVKSAYIGWPSGYATAPSYTSSNLLQSLAVAPLKVSILPYSEVAFIRAEAGFYGWNTGGVTVQSAYESGVIAAAEQWGAVITSDYFTNTDAAYNNTIERIMLQKYYALFFCDYQQWYEYMRTGLPALPRGDGIAEGSVMPHRFQYPETSSTTNMNNYHLAVEHMGGDTFSEKLWWQK